MDAIRLFFERYEGFREYPERLVEGLTEDQLRHSPHPSQNPIAWTLWHIARYEDMGVNRLLTDGGAGDTAAEEIVEAYLGHTRGWLLGHLALTHNFYHIGQAFGVRAMLGAPTPW